MTRTITVRLTYEEHKAIMWAVGNMTDGNARDIDEIALCGISKDEAETLLRAESKMDEAERKTRA